MANYEEAFKKCGSPVLQSVFAGEGPLPGYALLRAKVYHPTTGAEADVPVCIVRVSDLPADWQPPQG